MPFIPCACGSATSHFYIDRVGIFFSKMKTRSPGVCPFEQKLPGANRKNATANELDDVGTTLGTFGQWNDVPSSIICVSTNCLQIVIITYFDNILYRGEKRKTKFIFYEFLLIAH